MYIRTSVYKCMWFFVARCFRSYLHFPDSLAARCDHMTKSWLVESKWKHFVCNFLVMT